MHVFLESTLWNINLQGYKCNFYENLTSWVYKFPSNSNLVCIKKFAIRTTSSHMLNITEIIYYTYSIVIDTQCTRYKNAFNKRF